MRTVRYGALNAKPRGQTLIELMFAMTAATVLMVGLSTALFISSKAFYGQEAARSRSEAAEVQTAMMNDLQTATGFTTNTASAVTFTVPDRNGDTSAETVSYTWDNVNQELNYTYNGSTPETLLTGVNNFNLTYLTRSLTGTTPTPPALDPNSWGMLWDSGLSLFGYDTLFGDTVKAQKVQVGMKANLPENGSVEQITAYFEVPNGGMQVTAAIYDVDGSGDPNNLMVAAGIDSILADGWHTFAVTPTSLTAGDYYICLSMDDKNGRYHKDPAAPGTIETRSNDPFGSGWDTTWSNPSSTSSGTISIYAEYAPE